MVITEHIWRTTDGRLVRHGDPEAAFLAYPAGTVVADPLAEQVGLVAFTRDLMDAKLGEQPQDKAVRRRRDKAATVPPPPPAGNPGVVADTSIDGEAHVLIAEPGSPLRNGVDQ